MRFVAGVYFVVLKTVSIIIGSSNSDMIIGIKRIEESPFAGVRMKGLNIQKKADTGVWP